MQSALFLRRALLIYGKTVADIYSPALRVQRSFIEAAFDQILKSYGSMNDDIEERLELDLLTQTELCRKLLRVELTT